MIDLMDTTFIIPVRIDSPDRLRNLTTSVAYLKKNFITHIHIVEHDITFKVPEELARSVEYTFLATNDPLFYKTLAINDAVKWSKTNYFSIYDVDVLVPVPQLVEAIRQLRMGFSQVVFPYDGRFLDVPETIVPSVVSSLSTDTIDEKACSLGLGMPEVTPDRQSFGGAVLFERKTFIKGGMANEHLVSYGPEDIELYVRFKKLGYAVTRTSGPLFHLHHQRGMNSMENHPKVQKNHAEFKKIMDMSSDLLTFYVSSWPWARGVQ